MSHFHLWGGECSHSSAVMFRRDWKVFLCVSSCEINRRGGREVKRVGVSAKRRFWLHGLFFFYFQLSNDPLKAPKSSLVHTLRHDRWCVFITKSIEWMSTPAPTVHSFPECHATKTEYWNMYHTLPRIVIFRINYEKFDLNFHQYLFSVNALYVV